MIAIRPSTILWRVAGAAALILLGFALWGGQLYALLNLQMGLGVAVVLALWVLAILAYAAARLVALLWEAFLGCFYAGARTNADAIARWRPTLVGPGSSPPCRRQRHCLAVLIARVSSNIAARLDVQRERRVAVTRPFGSRRSSRHFMSLARQ
jgi:hypothetical protein